MTKNITFYLQLFLIFIAKDIIPVLSVNNYDYYYDNWCGEGLQYLDDAKCAKVFPSSSPDREWSCPMPILDQAPKGYVEDSPLTEINIDITSLDGIVTTGANICVILTKRVKDKTYNNIKLYNKYFCAGEASKSEVWETWSSSKIFAMANAGGHLRTNETNCPNQIFGLASNTTGKHGPTELGDLATIVCSYDHTAGYSSNSLSSYFHDLGWRGHLHDLVNSDWLGLVNMTLGGNYGEATPSDLSLSLTSVTNDDISVPVSQVCNADKDPWPVLYSNSLSALAAAEMTRRIALYREIDPLLRFPGMQWIDAQAELMGAEVSQLFPGLAMGGMMVDTSIFLQAALNMTAIDNQSLGQWRIHSKLGAGFSTSRYRGEIVSNAYACLPIYDDAAGAFIDGYEFTISVRGSISNDYTLIKVEKQVHGAVNEVVQAIMQGLLK